MISPEDDGNCFVCGPENPSGLRLRFISDGEYVSAKFILDKTYQGYKGVLHGGIISALLDEAMVKAAIYKGYKPVTVEIAVRFKSPLMTDEEAEVLGRVEKTGKLILTSAEVKRASDGKLIASATGKLLP